MDGSWYLHEQVQSSLIWSGITRNFVYITIFFCTVIVRYTRYIEYFNALITFFSRISISTFHPSICSPVFFKPTSLLYGINTYHLDRISNWDVIYLLHFHTFFFSPSWWVWICIFSCHYYHNLFGSWEVDVAIAFLWYINPPNQHTMKPFSYLMMFSNILPLVND